MKVKTVVWAGVICFFLICMAFFILDPVSAVLVAAAAGYTGVLSAWLGFDIAKTRDRTLSKKAGEWEDLRISRYLFALISIGVLLVISIIYDGTTGEYESVKVLLIPCFFGMGAMIIGAYGAVKTATPKGPEK